ncbi:MAG TPA: histidinol-phosphate transaminase [Bacteroidota bacterium]|nr:histidinol-phosphate transaminase [Bacteroidota bacterium]
MSFLDKIKPGIRALDAYNVRGKAFAPDLIKLNQNENPFDVPDEIKKELVDEFMGKRWNRYPGVFPAELVNALSSYTGHSPEGIIAGNGSNELMYTVLMATVTKGTKVLLPAPSFFLYEKAVKILDGDVVEVLMNSDLSFPVERILKKAKETNPSVIILVSPNSPTGQSISVGNVERILAETSAIVLVDEAYIEFSDKPSVQSLLPRYDRLVILRTFSKAFSLAGLRIGYLLAQPGLCAEIMKPKIPFTVNAFSASVSMKLMKKQGLVGERIAYIKNQKKILFDALRAIKGVEVFPSDTNFLIFKTPLEARILFERLLKRNVLIRDVSSYPMLERTLRVNAGTEQETAAFLAVLHEIL